MNLKHLVSTKTSAQMTTTPNQHIFLWFITHYIFLQTIIFPFKESETGGELRQLTQHQQDADKLANSFRLVSTLVLPSTANLLIEFNVPGPLKDTVSHRKVLSCRLSKKTWRRGKSWGKGENLGKSSMLMAGMGMRMTRIWRIRGFSLGMRFGFG